MKRCSICGSIVSDSDLVCGVCGRDLLQADQLVEDSGAIVVQKAKAGWHVNVPGLSGLAMGLVFVGVGVYFLITAASYAGALLSLLTIGFGITVIEITRDVVENRRINTGRYNIPRVPYGRIFTSRYVRNERSVEDEEDRKRASGEED